MNFTEMISKNQHAYALEGDFPEVAPGLKVAVEKIFKFKAEGNPDYREKGSDSFGIDEARELKEEVSRMAFSGELKFFVIGTASLTREAQNALLKVFEEPTGGTYLFLIVPNFRQIIPTLRSRLKLIKTGSQKAGGGGKSEAEEFLSAPPEKRAQLPFIKKLIEEKERAKAMGFLNTLEKAAREARPAEKMSASERNFLADLIKYRGYLGDRSPSIKMILEHISLVAPRF